MGGSRRQRRANRRRQEEYERKRREEEGQCLQQMDMEGAHHDGKKHRGYIRHIMSESWFPTCVLVEFEVYAPCDLEYEDGHLPVILECSAVCDEQDEDHKVVKRVRVTAWEENVVQVHLHQLLPGRTYTVTGELQFHRFGDDVHVDPHLSDGYGQLVSPPSGPAFLSFWRAVAAPSTVSTPHWPHDQASTDSILECLTANEPASSRCWTLLGQPGAGFPDMHVSECLVQEAAGVMKALQDLPLVVRGEEKLTFSAVDCFGFVPSYLGVRMELECLTDYMLSARRKVEKFESLEAKMMEWKCGQEELENLLRSPDVTSSIEKRRVHERNLILFIHRVWLEAKELVHSELTSVEQPPNSSVERMRSLFRERQQALSSWFSEKLPNSLEEIKDKMNRELGACCEELHMVQQNIPNLETKISVASSVVQSLRNLSQHEAAFLGMSQGEEVQMPHSGQSLESILQQYTMWLTACENTYQKSEIRELELKNQAARLRERLETCSAIILDVADPLQKDVEEDVLDCSERAQCADRCMDFLEAVHQLVARQHEELDAKREKVAKALMSSLKRTSIDLNKSLQERIFKLRRAMRQHQEMLDKQNAKEDIAVESENEALRTRIQKKKKEIHEFLACKNEELEEMLYLLKSTGMNEATPSDFLSLAGTDQAHSPAELEEHMRAQVDRMRRKIFEADQQLLNMADMYTTEVTDLFLQLQEKNRDVNSYSDVQDLLVCPLTMELFVDPVSTPTGHTYERGAIQLWLRDHNTDPLTNLVLASSSLTPNHVARQMAQAVRDKARSKDAED